MTWLGMDTYISFIVCSLCVHDFFLIHSFIWISWAGYSFLFGSGSVLNFFFQIWNFVRKDEVFHENCVLVVVKHEARPDDHQNTTISFFSSILITNKSIINFYFSSDESCLVAKEEKFCGLSQWKKMKTIWIEMNEGKLQLADTSWNCGVRVTREMGNGYSNSNQNLSWYRGNINTNTKINGSVPLVFSPFANFLASHRKFEMRTIENCFWPMMFRSFIIFTFTFVVTRLVILVSPPQSMLRSFSYRSAMVCLQS